MRGESVLDYWNLTSHDVNANVSMNLIVTEDGTGYACSINGTDVNMHTISQDGNFETLLVETLSVQADECAIAIGIQH